MDTGGSGLKEIESEKTDRRYKMGKGVETDGKDG